jgi:hypothetical protein
MTHDDEPHDWAELTERNLRWAIRRIIELAAAWDGSAPFDDDPEYAPCYQLREILKTLAVAEAAIDRRTEQFYRAALADQLHDAITPIYESIRAHKITMEEAFQRLRDVVADRYWDADGEVPSPEEIDRIARLLCRDENYIKSHAHAGPSMSAAQSAGGILHPPVDWRMVLNYKKTVSPDRWPPLPSVRPPAMTEDEVLDFIRNRILRPL